MLSVDPALMPFIFVLASVEGGDWNVTAMKVKNASNFFVPFYSLGEQRNNNS